MLEPVLNILTLRSKEAITSFIERTVHDPLGIRLSMQVSISSDKVEVLVVVKPSGRGSFIEAKEVDKPILILLMVPNEPLDLPNAVLKVSVQPELKIDEVVEIDEAVFEVSFAVLEATGKMVDIPQEVILPEIQGSFQGSFLEKMDFDVVR